jgi:hypothetical protein
MKSIGIKKCDYSSFNSFTFLAINFVLVYKLVSRLSGSLSMSTTIKDITRKNYTKPYFSGNEFLDISNSFNQLLVGMKEQLELASK